MYKVSTILLLAFLSYSSNVVAGNEFATIDVFPVAPDSIKLVLDAQVSAKKERRLVMTSFSVNLRDRLLPEGGNVDGTVYGWYFMDQEKNQFWLGKVIEPDMTKFKFEFILPSVLQINTMSWLASNRKQLSLTLFQKRGLPNFLVHESGKLLYVPITKVRLIIPNDFKLVSYPGWEAEGSNIVWNAKDQKNDCTLRADLEWMPVGDKILSFVGFVLGGLLSGLVLGVSIRKVLKEKLKQINLFIGILAGILSGTIFMTDLATLQWVVLFASFGVALIISAFVPDKFYPIIDMANK